MAFIIPQNQQPKSVFNKVTDLKFNTLYHAPLIKNNKKKFTKKINNNNKGAANNPFPNNTSPTKKPFNSLDLTV